MISCDLFKLSFIQIFWIKRVRRVCSKIFWHSKIRSCVIKAREMYIFLLPINMSATITWRFLVLSVSAIIAVINICVFTWIVFINIFMSMINFTRVFNKCFRVIKMLKSTLSRLLSNNWYFALHVSLAYK